VWGFVKHTASKNVPFPSLGMVNVADELTSVSRCTSLAHDTMMNSTKKLKQITHQYFNRENMFILISLALLIIIISTPL
jgi:hypothetical protein